MDEHYDTWIANLIAGRTSPAEQAIRDQFRALQAPAVPQPAIAHASVDTAGQNVWASETGHGDHALTSFTLLAGPGRFANCAGK